MKMYHNFVKRYTKPLASILLFVVLVNLNPEQHFAATKKQEQERAEATCHLRELELCSVGVLSIFQNPNGLPANEVEMRRQCEYLNESIQCFDDYEDRCLTKIQLPLVTMFTDDLVEVGHEFCSPDSELRKNYTKHVKCLRDIQRQYQRPCLTDLQVGFEGIHKMNRSQRLSTTCCNVNRFKECIFSRVEDECGEAAMEMISLLIERMTGGFCSIVCRNYDPFEETCQRLLPKVGSKPHNGRNTSAISRIISGFTNVPSQDLSSFNDFPSIK